MIEHVKRTNVTSLHIVVYKEKGEPKNKKKKENKII